MQRRTFLLGALAATARGADAQFPTLEVWRGVHPRLMLTAEREQTARAGLTGPLAVQWNAVKALADQYAAQKPPAFHDDGDPEQLWQRNTGNAQPFLAMAARLTGDDKYRKAAEAWCLASCGYTTWGAGTSDGGDLAAGHQLMGIALCYDWLYDRLSPEASQTMRTTLAVRGRQMLAAANGKMYWATSYLQNHLWVNAAALATAGLALFDDSQLGGEALTWVKVALDKFRTTENSLGPDGASHEGAPYWTYGVEYMLKFWAMASDLLGEDMTSPWWAHSADYRLYLGLPRKTWTRTNTLVDIADAPTYDWYGPDYMLRRLAARYGDGHAQWLAGELEAAQATQNSAGWLNLLWYDPTITAVPPDNLPPLHHFADMGIVSARSDWSGNESLVVFKCGPPAGHDAQSKFTYDPGCGHVHPDANHFVLFGAGEWLIRDDGYAWKQTDQHNTLLIDGKGQVGEGSQWFQGLPQIKLKAQAHIVAVGSDALGDVMVGDASAIYQPAAGLTRFFRWLIFLRPDVLLVLDDVALTPAHNLELRFHPALTGVLDGTSTFTATGKSAALRIQALTPDGVTSTAGNLAMRDRDGNAGTVYTLRLSTRAAAWRNAVAISWAPAGTAPAKVALEQQGGLWRFVTGGRTVDFRWD